MYRFFSPKICCLYQEVFIPTGENNTWIVQSISYEIGQRLVKKTVNRLSASKFIDFSLNFVVCTKKFLLLQKHDFGF